MNIRPTEDWCWYFDEKLDTLMVELSHDIVFRSRLSKKMIIIDALAGSAFSVQDATLYYQFFENCEILSLSEPNKVELVLNAIAVRNYIKPPMPKSWYFVQQTYSFVPRLGEIIGAYVQDSGEKVTLLVADVGDNASLCVIAQPMLAMAGKKFYLGDAIKIMNNRFVPYRFSSQHVDDAFDFEKKTLQQFLNEVC